MSPTEYRPGRGIILWRGLIIVALVAVALLAAAVVALFNTNHDAIQKGKEAIANSRALNCRIGGFLVGFPVVKQPGTSEADFEKGVQKAIDFLHALRAENCNGLGKVTTAKINAQTKALHKVVPKGGGGPTANAPPSSSGGGPSGPSPSPPTPGPQPGPPPTVPPPTVPPPTTTPGPIPNLICHINPLGIRICVNR